MLNVPLAGVDPRTGKDVDDIKVSSTTVDTVWRYLLDLPDANVPVRVLS